MCDEKMLLWMFVAIGCLNALSCFLDWLAKVIPGETDDKIIFYIKLVIGFVRKVIDFFTARGRR